MVRLFVRHQVSDYTAWRQFYDAFEEERQKMGVTDHAIYQSADDPNDVTTWHEFGTQEQAESFVSSDHLAQGMRGSGVRGPVSVWIVTEAT